MNRLFAIPLIGLYQVLLFVALLFYLCSPCLSQTELRMPIFRPFHNDIKGNSYIDLSLPIRHVALDAELGKQKFTRGELVYASIEGVGETYKTSSISRLRPAQGLYLRARVDSVGPRIIFLRFGIEQFFVTSSAVDALKLKSASGRLKGAATIKVSSDGRSVLSDVTFF